MTASPRADQCEGCTFYNGQVRELSYLHSRDITYATLCQGPYEESVRYRDFMGWTMPWYSAQESLDTLLIGRQIGKFHLVCYVRDGDRVFETYWTNGRGDEALDNSYALMDLTVYGRQEPWEDSPARLATTRAGRPISMRRRTPLRPMVAHRSRALRRPPKHRILTCTAVRSISAGLRDRASAKRTLIGCAVLVGVAGGCWILSAVRMDGMDAGPAGYLGATGWFMGPGS